MPLDATSFISSDKLLANIGGIVRQVSMAQLAGAFGGSTITVAGAVLGVGSGAALDIRNGAVGQAARVFNPYTDGSNGEWGFFGWVSNTLRIATEKNGSGVNRDMQ